MPIYKASWCETRTDEDRSPNVLAFLAELDDLCRKHGVSLAHEDSHGAFIIEQGFEPGNAEGASERVLIKWDEKPDAPVPPSDPETALAAVHKALGRP